MIPMPFFLRQGDDAIDETLVVGLSRIHRKEHCVEIEELETVPEDLRVLVAGDPDEPGHPFGARLRKGLDGATR